MLKEKNPRNNRGKEKQKVYLQDNIKKYKTNLYVFL
jgi:hypothetical protein